MIASNRLFQWYGLWCRTRECGRWRTTSSSTSRWPTSSTPPSTSSPTSLTCSREIGLLVSVHSIKGFMCIIGKNIIRNGGSTAHLTAYEAATTAHTAHTAYTAYSGTLLTLITLLILLVSKHCFGAKRRWVEWMDGWISISLLWLL